MIESETFDVAEFGAELEGEPNLQVGSRLLLENERVRIWEINLEPGARLPFHWHVTPYLFVCVEAGRVRTRFPNGTAITMDVGVGDPWFAEHSAEAPEVHDLENVGATVVRFTTVELL